jgi:hypothetical protein
MIHLLHAAAGLVKLVGRFVVGKIQRTPFTVRQTFREHLTRQESPSTRAVRVMGEIIERTEEQRGEMTIQQQRAQALSFAYGNLAASAHHKPNVFAFWQVAQNDGWGKDDFEAWASEREWE